MCSTNARLPFLTVYKHLMPYYLSDLFPSPFFHSSCPCREVFVQCHKHLMPYYLSNLFPSWFSHSSCPCRKCSYNFPLLEWGLLSLCATCILCTRAKPHDMESHTQLLHLPWTFILVLFSWAPPPPLFFPFRTFSLVVNVHIFWALIWVT